MSYITLLTIDKKESGALFFFNYRSHVAVNAFLAANCIWCATVVLEIFGTTQKK